MNPIDRFQALIRHVEYRNDPRIALRGTHDLLTFGLPLLFRRDGLFSERYNNCRSGFWADIWKYGQFLMVWGLEFAVDPQKGEDVELVLTDLRNGNYSIFSEDLRGYDASEGRSTPDSEYGNFFTFSVDLERPTGELLELVRKMIDAKRQEREIETKRQRQHSVDPWMVWDMAQVPGNSLQKITHIHFKVKGNPAYDEETKRCYDQVQRAHRKATYMIEEVGRRRSKAPTKEEVEESGEIFYSMMEETIRSVHAKEPANIKPMIERIIQSLNSKHEFPFNSLKI